MSSSELAIYGISSSRRVKENVAAARVRSSTPSSSSTPHAPRLRPGQRNERPQMPKVAKGRQHVTAKDVLSETCDENVTYIHPFRKTQYHNVPEGVPPLRLGKLMRGDDMEPIAVRKYVESNQSSPRSEIQERRTLPSHQPPADVPHLDLTALKSSSNAKRAQSTTPAKPQVRSAWGEDTLVPKEEPKKQAVIDEALEKNITGTSTLQQPIQEVRQTPPLYAGGRQVSRFARTRHSSMVLSAPEMAMSDRVRFNARVITSNGRDIHRELCGFFFGQDNSLTLYEFRQLSSRSSALPLIQRRAYTHAKGPRAGEPITLADITPGVSLTFSSCDQISLPASMKCRTYVEFRVTDVDDAAKERVVRHNWGRRGGTGKLVRERNDAEDMLASLVSTIQSQVHSQIKERACHVWLSLTRHLSKLNKTGDGLVRWSEFTHALVMYHIRIDEEDLERLASLLYGGDTDLVDFSELLHCCLGQMNERRHLLVRKIFIKMDAQKAGYVLVSEVKKFFNPRGHPDVMNGQRTEYDVSQELFSMVAGPRQRELSYAEFEAFYEGTSRGISDDETFIELMRRCWNV